MRLRDGACAEHDLHATSKEAGAGHEAKRTRMNRPARPRVTAARVGADTPLEADENMRPLQCKVLLFWRWRDARCAHRSEARECAKQRTCPIANDVCDAPLLSSAPETLATLRAEQQRGPRRRSGGHVCNAPVEVPGADAARTCARRMESRTQCALRHKRVSGSTRPRLTASPCCVTLSHGVLVILVAAAAAGGDALEEGEGDVEQRDHHKELEDGGDQAEAAKA